MLRHFHLHLRLFNNLQHMLVGGIPTPLKNMKVSWDDDIPNIWKIIKFMFQTTSQYVSWSEHGLKMLWASDNDNPKASVHWRSVSVSTPCLKQGH